MSPNLELFFETTARAFLGDKAQYIAGQAHSEKNRRECYRKIFKVILRKLHEVETSTSHQEELISWSEKALEIVSKRNHNEIELNFYLLRLIAALIGFMGLRPYNVATLAYFQSPSQNITQISFDGGDIMQDYCDKENAVAIRRKLIKQLKGEGLSDYRISMVFNISEYQVKKLRKNL